MNILHQQVLHRQFGSGEVIAQDSHMISVRFSEETGVKKFLYPLAFSNFLTLCDQTACQAVREELLQSSQAAEAERSLRMAAETRRIEEERARLAEQRRATLRKRLASRQRRTTPARSAVPAAAEVKAEPAVEG